MSVEIEPLAADLEAALRSRLAANPFVNFMGIAVPQLGRGYARFILPLRPDFLNSQGFLQGGVIAALADEAVAYALFSLAHPEELLNTVEMKINFLAPAQQGELEAQAHIVKRGRTISLGEVTVRQGERLVAMAMCTYLHQAPRQ